MSRRNRSSPEVVALRDEVTALLKVRPMRLAEIYDASELAEHKKQIANLLFLAKRAGSLVQLEDGRYELPGAKTAAPASPGAEKKATRRTRKPASEIKPRPDGDQVDESLSTRLIDNPVRKQLLAAHIAYEIALERYARSVGDDAVVDALVSARDSARRAVDAYDAGSS